MKRKSLAVLGSLALASVAGAQEAILSLDFEDQNGSGWTANGQQMMFDGGNPGIYMGVPYLDFFGVQLSAREESSQVFGDLSRYGTGGLRISFDVRVFALNNFAEEPIDPANFPLVMQMWNYDIPAPGIASVYIIGDPLPRVEDGWVRRTYVIPNPTQTTLPESWGGTGDEDPNTFEPKLPDGVTYADVLANVGQLDFTTFVPGYFYGFNFWEVGWDNLVIETLDGAPECPADFNGDGFLDFFDYDDYVNCFETANCPEGRTADFNGDAFVDFFDYDAYVSAFEQGC